MQVGGEHDDGVGQHIGRVCAAEDARPDASTTNVIITSSTHVIIASLADVIIASLADIIASLADVIIASSLIIITLLKRQIHVRTWSEICQRDN